jgi:ribosomal protein L13
MSTIKVDTIKNTSNVEVFTAKAWVNFNGTGTVAIRASGNVSSVTDNGTGNYFVNFTTAMTDLNYCTVVNAEMVSVSGETSVATIPTSSSSQKILTFNNTTSLTDARQVNVAVFR